jgi:hypothetical protein
MNGYCGLVDIKKSIDEDQLRSNVDFDNQALELLLFYSRMADRICNRTFFAYDATRYYDTDLETRKLIDEFISLSSVSYSTDDGDSYTSLTVTTDYVFESSYYDNISPYDFIVLRESGSLYRFPVSQRGLKVVGTFGYLPAISPFYDSLDTLQDVSLSASATSITVSESNGYDSFGREYRFQAGHVIRINSEYLYVSKVDYDNNKLTVVRGVNGSTASASHSQNDQIEVLNVPHPVKEFVIFSTIGELYRRHVTRDVKESFLNIRSNSFNAVDLLQPYQKIAI